jgi:hypothetical protein
VRTRVIAPVAIAACVTLLGSGLREPASASESVVDAQADWQYAYPGFAQPVSVTSNDRCSPTPALSDVCSTSATFASLEVVDPPTLGQLVVDGRTFLYTGDVDATGEDHFTYRVTDIYGVSAEAGVTIALWPVPGPPVLGDDSADALTNVEVQIEFWRNDVIPALNARAEVVTQPAHGTARVTPERANELYYTSDPGFTGVDTFQYSRTDELGQTDTAVVTVTVSAPPPPVAGSREYTMLSGARRRLLSMFDGSTIPNGTTHTYGSPQHGTLIVRTPDIPVYVPAPGFVGDDTLEYTLTNSVGESSVGHVTIHVRPQPILTLDVQRPYAYYPSYMAFGSVTATAPDGRPMANVHVRCQLSGADTMRSEPTNRHGQTAVRAPKQASPRILMCRAPGVHTEPVEIGMQPHISAAWPKTRTAGIPFDLYVDVDYPARPDPQILVQRKRPSGWVTIGDASWGPVTLERDRPGRVEYRVYAPGTDTGWVASVTPSHTITWVSP